MLLLFLFILHFIEHIVSVSDAPVVDLGYAKYVGSYVGNTTHFVGMRYAAPPLDALRWRAPTTPESTLELVQNATHVPAQCPQSDGSGASETNPFLGSQNLTHRTIAENVFEQREDLLLSEDCLYLSVYSPGNVNPFTGANTSWPVIFWIHGGGYQGGSATADSAYDLISVFGGRVVVVVIQYRLGLFGFLAEQSVKDGGVLNAGILDQQFALEWTQQHVSKFGGDPAEVTIWGESAGAGSVLQHIIANGGKTEPPLFKRASHSRRLVGLGRLRSISRHASEIGSST
ncbi:alpha/beta-hydrolase [Cylindrobasidium torrendii FP15055 ss-10]|uniref:Carboxylic ester hydrolase n=1 Tax=Cylindrobasidium torrendii FP15055 ss-10 TaxID=1314674 RepID=A0A0D7AVY5_9AGAR|nr:alpha/beta-hydrolase [Cylindrobasidium torrendii FP15055 ss-10]